jgi:hypothetical protein
MARRPWFPLIAVLLLVVSSVGAITIGGGTAPRPSPLPARASASGVHPEGNTSINDDLVLNGTPPAGRYAPGTLVQVQYRVTVLSASGASNATVWVPQLLANFGASPSAVNLFLPAHELNVTVGGTANAPIGEVALRNVTSFNGTRPATLNSQLVALMGSLPFGQLAVSAEWNWTITASDGSSVSSGWAPSNSTVIHPAEIAYLGNLTPRQLVTPAPVTACLNGPLQERTFSLHAETVSPVDDFVGSELRDPINGPPNLCLTVVIPTNITPQTILMHIWDYESVTLLLYIVKVKVLSENATSTTNASVLPGDWSDYANAAIVVGAVGLAIAVALVVRRDGAGPRGKGPPPGAELAPGADPPVPGPADATSTVGPSDAGLPP